MTTPDAGLIEQCDRDAAAADRTTLRRIRLGDTAVQDTVRLNRHLLAGDCDAEDVMWFLWAIVDAAETGEAQTVQFDSEGVRI